jgi:ribonucleoside-diphosphate reductase alpha chain
VFKTASELNQMDLIMLAAQRQKYICQAQSVNIYFPANINVKDLHKVHFSAWKEGLKSLYYLRSESVKATEIVSVIEKPQEVEEKKPKFQCTDDVCISCEG